MRINFVIELQLDVLILGHTLCVDIFNEGWRHLLESMKYLSIWANKNLVDHLHVSRKKLSVVLGFALLSILLVLECVIVYSSSTRGFPPNKLYFIFLKALIETFQKKYYKTIFS